MKPPMPITAIHRDGRTIVFGGWVDFLRWAAKVPFDEKFSDPRPAGWTLTGWSRGFPRTEWIVRDNNGKPLVKDKIDFSPIETPWWKAYYKQHRRAAELGLPIPDTAHRHYQRHKAPQKKNSGYLRRARDWVRGKYDQLDLGEAENSYRIRQPRSNDW